MSQKYIKHKNNNMKSTAFGKYFAYAVYNKKSVGTDDLADLIEKMTTVNHADVVAVLNGLGNVMSHYLKAGEKVYLKDIGTFKVGFSSIGVNNAEDVTANNIFNPRVLFHPETVHIPNSEPKKVVTEGNGEKIVRGYSVVKKMIEGIVFEETHDNAMNVEPKPEP